MTSEEVMLYGKTREYYDFSDINSGFASGIDMHQYRIRADGGSKSTDSGKP